MLVTEQLPPVSVPLPVQPGSPQTYHRQTRHCRTAAAVVQVPCPDDLYERFRAKTLQFTLVDCPGHASLLKTVLVGAHIIDMMLLVVDATKGIQAQTAECVIVGELLSQCAVVALNKTDLFPADRRQKEARRAGRTVVSALQLTRFASAEIVPVAAKVAAAAAPAEATLAGEAPKRSPSEPRGGTAAAAANASVHAGGEAAAPGEAGGAGGGGAEGAAARKAPGLGIDDLKAALLRAVPQLKRDVNKPLLFMADHCFPVKGHGTVLSGATQPRCDRETREELRPMRSPPPA